MKKRDFIKTGTILGVGAMVGPMISCNSGGGNKNAASADAQTDQATGPFTLPDLPYGHDALEPYIDTQTMQIHHGKHHAGYVRKLNKALEGVELNSKDLASIVSAVGEEDAGVRNNGGGHYNHSLFWKIMKPGGGNLAEGNLRDAINSSFGSFDDFKSAFSNAAATRFGSGWAWLSADKEGKLFVSSTPNQDNPLMASVVEQAGSPIMGIDVWEHAYYLKYQNMRKEYISNFFQLINWEEVANNYALLG